ncbi:transcriptional regulator [Paraburkholderia sp. 1N]|uniref:Transcriptional regulator n=1 Tax=Paraburkholderia solitsugae TaxID=2675748 RepID=A0ABX2C6C6_9BURK|nr:winged helix-turn-helix domain-containing protein [Paraburkholderia solitsugae]NPT47635.1 transcriptional regulator [Paraburkholderia solitsugae]
MLRIGDLEIDFVMREVRRNGAPLRVGSRAFDILELLNNANGELVSKDEILRVVWPRTVVEENNLQVQISALRKVFGSSSQLIRTVSGRGYKLLQCTNAVRAEHSCNTQSDAALVASIDDSQTISNGSIVDLFGRDLTLAEVLTVLKRREMVTLVGTGGIGKTRLAIEAARKVAPAFPDGVAVISFSSVTDERFALDAAAAGLRMNNASAPLSVNTIVDAVRGKRLLIVLDNCEHVVGSAANIALALRNSGHVILATSREPLRIPDEALYPVPPLVVPEAVSTGGAVLLTGAAQLFLARVREVAPEFTVDERTVLLIGAVCRALDGIPLAIELAAARAALIGIEVLGNCLNDRLRILTGGCRTAPPRHQTMRATLDWSYRLLSDIERSVLRRLGVFIGGFTFDAIRFLTVDRDVSTWETLDAFCGLVSKSMVAAQLDGNGRRYRLLETTRDYALQQLDDNGERNAALAMHARYLLTLFGEAPAHATERTDEKRQADFTCELDNVRAALEWSFSSSGDPSMGVALASATVPYLFDLPLLSECCSRARQALAVYNSTMNREIPPEAVLKLRAALAAGLVYTKGPGPDARHEWMNLYADAVLQRNTEYEARALWGLWNAHQYGGEPKAALLMARRFCDLARGQADVARSLLGIGIEGITLHYLGDQRQARARLEEMLAAYDHSEHRWSTTGFRIEHGIAARATLSRVLWVQGSVQRALELAQSTLEAAIDYDNEMVTCYVLVEAAIPLAILSDDLVRAREAIAALRERVSRMSFPIWIAVCACYEQCVAAAASPNSGQLRLFSIAIEHLAQTGFRAPLTFLLCRYGQALANCGDAMNALKAVDQAIEHGNLTGEHWLHAELCRVKRKILSTRENGPFNWGVKHITPPQADRLQHGDSVHALDI